MSAYVVGIWAGYIIFKQDSKKLHLSPVRRKEYMITRIPGYIVMILGILANMNHR